MTRLVITGASGFVGRHAMRLLAGRFDVLAVSRRPVATGSCVRVADYAETPGGEVLLHLAETSLRSAVERDPDAYFRAAVSILERLIPKFRTVVYASSAAVYGDASRRPHAADAPATARDAYTRTKLACETRVLAAGGAVARLANLYGDGMAADTVVMRVLDQLGAPGSLTVMDDSPVRDFLWIEDAVDALSRAADLRPQGIYNVGSGVGTPIRVLAQTALAVAGEAGRPVVAERPSARVSCTILDVSATTRDLGWAPSTSLTDGLAHLIRSRGPLAPR